jgi:hypothetical protein
MFKIIGADQKEYGPISTEQIRQWIKDGRLNAQTPAQRDGGEWKQLGAHAEFADLFGTAGTPAPGPASAPAAAPFSSAPMAGGGSREAALQAVKAPAIILIVMASIGILLNLLGAFRDFTGANSFHQPPNANLSPAMVKWIETWQGPLGGVIALLFMAVNIFVLLGALKMMRLESRSMAVGACIAALIPLNCCCLLIPFGIWGLMVLNKPDIKSQFTS